MCNCHGGRLWEIHVSLFKLIIITLVIPAYIVGSGLNYGIQFYNRGRNGIWADFNVQIYGIIARCD